MCRNVQVARPSDSTSGGQCSARQRRASSSFAVDVVASAAAAAVEEAIACAAESPPELLLLLFPRVDVDVVVLLLPAPPVVPVPVGFQLRKEVQILHGLPSGPRTMPGGSGGALEGKDEDSAVEVSVQLELELIVAPLGSPRPGGQ